MIPPTVPTLSRGAINEGADQPTGAAMETPVAVTASQITADCTVRAVGTPKMQRPTQVPPTSTICRTRDAFQPRWMSESTSQPPTANSATVAQSHGMLVYQTELLR